MQHNWYQGPSDSDRRICARPLPPPETAATAADGIGYDEASWARSNRQTQEYWRDAESSLRQAVGLQPAASEAAYLLVHLLVCAGHIQQVPTCHGFQEATRRLKRFLVTFHKQQ